MNYGVVIPNRYSDIIQPLVVSIRKFEPNADVAVIADGHGNSYGFKFVPYTSSKFSFSKSVNLGIKYFEDKNIILINDDCVLLEPDTFQRLDEIGTEHGCAILSPLIKGCVGNDLQRWYLKEKNWQTGDGYIHIIDINLIKPFRGLCFPCVWVNRDAINTIGLMNENLTGYGGDDIEYCKRFHQRGLLLSITSSIAVQHGDGGPEMQSARGRTWSLSFFRKGMGVIRHAHRYNRIVLSPKTGRPITQRDLEKGKRNVRSKK